MHGIGLGIPPLESKSVAAITVLNVRRLAKIVQAVISVAFGVRQCTVVT